MSAVSETFYDLDTSPSLRKLPAELHHMIIASMLEDVQIYASADVREPQQRTTAHTILPLGSTNVYWHNAVLPYVFRNVDLQGSNARLDTFVTTLVKKYGQHCRRLFISLRLLNVDASDMTETTVLQPDEDERDVLSTTWHARRSTLLSLAIPHMRNIEHLDVYTDVCPWHGTGVASRSPCSCLRAYDSLLVALTVNIYPIRFLYFHFGNTHHSMDWSDSIASKLLEVHRDTLQFVKLSHSDWEKFEDSKSFNPRLSLRTAASLPRMIDLELMEVCGCTFLGQLHWQAPLQRLAAAISRWADYVVDEWLDDESTEEDGDISKTFAALPGSLQDLSWLFVATEPPNMCSRPFPPHLTALQKCEVWTLSPPFIDFFRSAPFHTLTVSTFVMDRNGNSNADHLLASLQNLAFPNLSTISLELHDISPRMKDWEQVCSERGISLCDARNCL